MAKTLLSQKTIDKLGETLCDIHHRQRTEYLICKELLKTEE